MKTVVSIILLACSLFAELEWQDNLENAFSLAKKEHKGVMIMISKEGCDACWYMEELVFEKEFVTDQVESSFIPMKYDTSLQKVPKQFVYPGTPTFYFLNEKGDVLAKHMGAINPKGFEKLVYKLGKQIKAGK